MKKFFKIVAFTFMVSAHSQDKENNVMLPLEGVPVVKTEATYKVLIEENISYAEGLSHQEINSKSSKKIPLKLDLYAPDNTSKNRPVIVLIHGGGFVKGSKEVQPIVKIANYFAERGWVAVSISYRLKKHKGTLPQEWIDYTANIPKWKIPPFMAIYPAIRDAKAAMRWVVGNAKTYGINTDYITVGGGSAGAITAIAVGISKPEDYRDELSTTQDSSLATTNLNQTYRVKTILDFWGGKTGLDILQKMDGNQRFSSAIPPVLIAHRIADPTVPFSNAEDLKAMYEKYKVPFAYYPLQGEGHGAWGEKVKNKSLSDLSFDFIIEQQRLKVER